MRDSNSVSCVVHLYKSVVSAYPAQQGEEEVEKRHICCVAVPLDEVATTLLKHQGTVSCPICQVEFSVGFVQSASLHKATTTTTRNGEVVWFKYGKRVYHVQQHVQHSSSSSKERKTSTVLDLMALLLGLETAAATTTTTTTKAAAARSATVVAVPMKVLHKGRVVYPSKRQQQQQSISSICQEISSLSASPASASVAQQDPNQHYHYLSKPALLVMGTPVAQHLKEPAVVVVNDDDNVDDDVCDTDRSYNNNNNNNNNLWLWAILPLAIVILGVYWNSSRTTNHRSSSSK